MLPLNLEPCEAVAAGLTDIFQEGSFRSMFIEPNKFGEHLRSIALLFLKAMDSAKKGIHSFQLQDSENFVPTSAFESVTDGLDRVEKVMRFIGSLLFKPKQFDQIAKLVRSTPLDASQDCLWLVGFSGKQQLEKGLQEIIAKSSQWSKLVDEVVKTASSSLKLKPQRDRAMETLLRIQSGQIDLSSERLEELNKLFPELMNGMRACDLEDINHLMMEQVTTLADALLEGKVEVAEGSKRVHALIKAFKVFSHEPGAVLMGKKLVAWMTEHEQEIVLNDLAVMAKDFEEDGATSLEDVQKLMARLNKVTIPKDRDDLRLSARKLLNASFRALIAEVGQGSFQVKCDTKEEMTQAQILKKTGLLSMVANLAGVDANTVDGKCHSLHIQIIKSGQSLKNAIFNLESLGEIEERVRRDKQKIRMTAVLQSHAQLSAHKRAFEQLQAEQAESDADDTSKQLFALDSIGAFAKLFELDMIYDTMARHFVVHGEVLTNACDKIEKGISKVSGDNNWKKTLVSTDPIERVLEAAACILKIDLKGAIAAIAIATGDGDKQDFLESGRGFIVQSQGPGEDRIRVIYVEQVLALALRQTASPKTDSSALNMAKTVVTDAFVFLARMKKASDSDAADSSECDASSPDHIQPSLNTAGKGLLG
eukprot:s399_g16.t1